MVLGIFNILPARSFSEDGFSPGSLGKRSRAGVLLEAVSGLVSVELERTMGTPRNSTCAGGGGSREAALMPCSQKLGWGAAQTPEHHLNQ